jgi:homoserine O-succinyltransferase
MDVISWAQENVASVLCSCLATHAVVQHQHGIRRSHMGRKTWGVFSHHISRPGHPLMRDVNTRFDAPHSRYNEFTREQLEGAGMAVLVESDAAGVHLAVSPDLFRIVYFQGHPEYDAVSLLKEYKREVMRFFNGEREDGPRYPENYFNAEAGEIARRYFHQAEKAAKAGEALPPFPDAELEALVDNTWGDTGKAIVNNWLGLVYNLTALDRREQFMPGVDPENPLGLRT